MPDQELTARERIRALLKLHGIFVGTRGNGIDLSTKCRAWGVKVRWVFVGVIIRDPIHGR